ncbi:MAG: DUF2330 domain-containing protein [Thermodesulfobacteriota bacterium]
MRKTMTAAGLLILLLCAPARADRGSLPFIPGVKIFEPNQRAILAWDGRQELMILSTDLQASAVTKVLEILPLPAEPKVSQAENEVFEKITALINRKLKSLKRPSNGGKKNGGRQGESPEAARVTFHERIGAHDLSVFQVLKPAEFISWVESYLRLQGASQTVIPEPLKAVAAEYLADGFTWFVFDVISLDSQTKTLEPIQYRFDSKTLYYPLRITRLGAGETTVDLVVLTPGPLKSFPGLPSRDIELRHELLKVTPAELSGASQDLNLFFGGARDLTLRLWKIHGPLSGFQRDLMAY